MNIFDFISKQSLSSVKDHFNNLISDVNSLNAENINEFNNINIDLNNLNSTNYSKLKFSIIIKNPSIESNSLNTNANSIITDKFLTYLNNVKTLSTTISLVIGYQSEKSKKKNLFLKRKPWDTAT